MSMLEELASWQVERLIARGAGIVVIPFGAVEHQGRHLPLGADAFVADAVGRAVADRLDAVLAPTCRVGCSGQHMHGAGTLTVPAETLRELATGVAQSLVTHGFGVLALVSTHGGNQAALAHAAQQLTQQHRGVVVCAPRGDVGPNPGSHSGSWLTSVMLSLRPDLVDMHAASEGLEDELHAATAESGAANLERFVSSVVQRVRDAARRRPSSDAGSSASRPV
jgi:creatinine amidohydrolase